MKMLVTVIVCGVSSLIAAGVAEAAPPAWCKGASTGTPDLGDLSRQDVRQVLKAFVDATCAPTPEVEAHRAEIESARQAWSRRLGMVEADWADVVPYLAARADAAIGVDLSTDVLSADTPIDQYALITRISGSASELYRKYDTFYATDMFEANLSQVGRFAFLATTCFRDKTVTDTSGILGTEVEWAICQADIERFDHAKFLDEVRADTAHDGAVRMKLRVEAFDIAKRIKDHAAEVQKQLKRDDANRKLFEVAAGARTEWSSTAGKYTKLLELVLAMDSAVLAQSRKQLDGCADRTAAALADAVATIPAKTFAGMIGKREEVYAGFVSKAGPVLVKSPAVNLAAIAFVQCSPASGIGKFLGQSLEGGPPLRGPRSWALGAIRAAKIVYDKVGAQLRYPDSGPYGQSYPDGSIKVMSGGDYAIVKSFKRNGDVLTIEMEKTLVRQEECVKSHSTGRIHHVNNDGSVAYERICDRNGIVAHDATLEGVTVAAKYAPLLKPGVRISTVGHDVIAVWPNKAAKTPSIVLGAAVK